MRATTLAHSGTSISSREQKKGIPTVRSVMTQERRNPFISGFFSLPLCILCHQNYRLDVARGNETTNSYPSLVQGNMSTDRCLFAKMRSGTYQRFSCSSGTCRPFPGTCPLRGTCRETGICLYLCFSKRIRPSSSGTLIPFLYVYPIFI